jgi:hypothetical protein
LPTAATSRPFSNRARPQHRAGDGEMLALDHAEIEFDPGAEAERDHDDATAEGSAFRSR